MVDCKRGEFFFCWSRVTQHNLYGEEVMPSATPRCAAMVNSLLPFPITRCWRVRSARCRIAHGRLHSQCGNSPRAVFDRECYHLCRHKIAHELFVGWKLTGSFDNRGVLSLQHRITRSAGVDPLKCADLNWFSSPPPGGG